MTFPPTTPPYSTNQSPNDHTEYYFEGNKTCQCQNTTTIIQVVCPNCTCPCPTAPPISFPTTAHPPTSPSNSSSTRQVDRKHQHLPKRRHHHHGRHYHLARHCHLAHHHACHRAVHITHAVHHVVYDQRISKDHSILHTNTIKGGSFLKLNEEK